MSIRSTTGKPLWLEMRTEYIDANFDKLTTYLNDNKAGKSDDFYIETLNLLHKRVAELISDISSSPLYEIDKYLSEDSRNGKDHLMFYIRLLGVFLLTGACQSAKERRIAFAYQQLLVSMICSSQRMISMTNYALKTILSDEIVSLGYNWNELLEDSPDLLSERIMKYSVVRSAKNESRWFEGVGVANVANGTLSLYNDNRTEIVKHKYALSLSAADSKVSVMSPSGDKLKQSLQGNIDAIKAYTESFIAGLHECVPEAKKLFKYHVDDKQALRVRITGKTFDKVFVETVDPKYEKMSGELRMNSTFNYTMIDCCKYLEIGYEIDVRLGSISKDGIGMFDMSPEFKKYVMEECVESGSEVLAKSLCVNKGNTMWITETGYIVYTNNREFDSGIFAELQIQNMSPTGYVYADFERESDDSFDEQEIRREMVVSFCYEASTYEQKEEKEPNDTVSVSELSAVGIALYILQRKVQMPSERYQMLCVLGIISKMAGNDKIQHLLDFMSQYLRCTVYFAQGRFAKMFPLEPEDDIADLDIVKRRTHIVEILRNYESLKDPEMLEETISGDDEALSKVAKLVQASNRMRGVLSDSNLNSIKREISKMLSVDDATATDLDEENGLYMGAEDINKEFKTSIVFPPDNGMKANPALQRTNVFKTVCAFLNSSTGGTLFLGVNDLGYAVGVSNDMEYLKKQTIDSYIRYVNDEAKNCFGLDVMTNIRISAMLDDKVVAIQVSPCDHKIVELDEKAYVRINAETREMDEETRITVQSRKKNFDRESARNEYALKSAIENRLCATLHGYRSNHGNDCHSRFVEPFAFAKGHKHIWCFEPESQMTKLFSISRIGNVEIHDDKPWQFAIKHKELSIDLFHMTGTEPIHMTLILDTMARNLLVEEFEGSDREIVEQKDGSWLFETDVFNLAGVGRFYIGLINHIEIVHAPGLREYAKEYLNTASKRISEFK